MIIASETLRIAGLTAQLVAQLFPIFSDIQSVKYGITGGLILLIYNYWSLWPAALLSE